MRNGQDFLIGTTCVFNKCAAYSVNIWVVLGRLWLWRNDPFWRQTSRFRFFLASIISDGRMYRRRIDVAMFVLSIGTISASHNGQLRRRRSAWTDVIVVQLASWAVNYSGRTAVVKLLKSRWWNATFHPLPSLPPPPFSFPFPFPSFPCNHINMKRKYKSSSSVQLIHKINDGRKIN